MSPTPSTSPTFARDTVAEDVERNLSIVSEFTETSLTQALKESEQIFQDPNADLEQVRQASQRLVDMIEASRSATRSLNSFKDGKKVEEKILTQAADSSRPLPSRTEMENWVAQACDYFYNSQQQVERTAKIISRDKGFPRWCANFFKKPDNDTASFSPVGAFWDKVSSAVFGLNVLTSRVVNLPRVLMERLENAIDARVVAVGDVVDQWRHRAQAEYSDLKQGLKNTVATLNDEIGDKWDHVASAGVALGKVGEDFVQTHMVDKYQSFIEKAKGAIQRWSASAYDLLNEQAGNFGKHYAEGLQQRRAGKFESIPAKQRIEPTL